MKKKYVILSLLAALISVVGTSCSNDDLSDVQEAATEALGAITGEEEQALLTVSVTAGVNENIVMSRAYQTEEEKAIYTLYIFLFALDEDVETTDATEDDYSLVAAYPFTTVEDNVTDDLPLLGSDGTGGYTTTLDATSLTGRTLRCFITANDAPSSYTVEESETTTTTDDDGNETTTTTITTAGTTLTDFRLSTATADIADSDHADALVGYPEEETATGFPMSASSDAFELNLLGVSLDVQLYRTMARLDVFNYTPNLTVTDIYVTNTPDQSYLFEQDELAEPSTSTYIKVTPYTEYCETTTTSDGGATTSTVDLIPLTYSDDFEDDLSEGYSTDDWYEACRDANSYTHVLYMYEQAVSSTATSPQIVINYTISTLTYEAEGQVTVPFYDADGNYVDVERNHLYRIILGDGNEISAGVTNVQLEVLDWYQDDETNTINTVVNPSTDTEVTTTTDDESSDDEETDDSTDDDSTDDDSTDDDSNTSVSDYSTGTDWSITVN